MKKNIFNRSLRILLSLLLLLSPFSDIVLADSPNGNQTMHNGEYIANDLDTNGLTRDSEQARKVAEDFLAETEVSLRSGLISSGSDGLELSYPNEEISFRSGLSSDEDSELYAFNKKSGGFVIVAGDKRATDILGYSNEGKFDLDSAPEELKSWIAEYENQIKYIRQNPNEFEDVVKQKSILHDEASSSQSSVAPFMNDIKWDQMEPYNRLAPDYVSGRKSAIGCVATAMAQVMKYYEYPQQGVKDASYEWTNSYNYNEKKTLTAEISKHTYNWDKMPKSYNGTEDEESKNEVAKLMYDAAVSAKMDFGPSSGTASLFAGQALVDNFGYDRGLKNLYRLAYNSNEWHNIVKEELMAKRPVFYGGTGAGGGHQFILDGFNDQNLYHVNWGWSGAGNGYYALDAMNPTFQGTGAGGGSYNMNQEILTGIKPADENITENRIRGNNTGKIFSYGTNNQIADLNKKEYRTTKSEIILSQWDITVEGMDGFNGEFGLGIDVNGTIRFSQNNKNFGTGHYLPNLPIAWQNLQIVDPIPDGEYEIKLYKKATGENEYTEIPNKQGQSDIIKVKVEGESVTYYLNELDKVNLEQISFAKSGDELYSGRTGKFTANIKNNGNNEYNSLMYIKLTDKSSGKTFNIGKRQIEIVAGGEREFDLEEELKYNNNNIPAGNYTATLMYNKGNTQEDISMDLYVPLGNSIDVEIKEFVEGKLAFVQNLEFVEKTEPKIVNDKNDLKISTKVKSTGGLYDVKFTAMVVDKLVSGTVNPIIQFTSTPVIVKDNETKEIFLECHEDISNLINEKDYYIIFVMNEGEWVTDYDGSGNPYFITFKYIKQEVDKSELQTKYNEVKDLEKGDYTDESWNAFNTARETAKTVLDKTDATQEEVDDAKTALETAITNLAEKTKVFNVTVKVEPSNATIKVTKKDETEEIVGTEGVYKLEAGEYTVTGKSEGYKDGSKDFTVATENMTVELTLTKIVNKEELQTAVNNAEGKVEAEYTPETWGLFAEALETAKDVLAKADATQKEVDDAKTALETAITNLAETAKVFDVTVTVEPSNATIKVTKKDETEEIVGTEGVYKLEAGEYTVTGTAEGYKEESKDFTVADREITVELSLTAIVNKSELQTAVTEAEGKVEAEYTPETWGPFAEALKTAKTVLDKVDATQKEVDDALKDLNDAHTGLKNNPVDKEALQTKYDEVKDLEKGDYTEESWNAFNTARETAKTVLDKADATKEEVDDALEKLNAAHTGLKNNPVDKSALQTKYDEVKDLEKGDYTDESWNAFITARETAKRVLDKADATKEEVANALKDLNDAHTGLKNNPVDKSALQTKYDEVKDLEKGDYTDESWNTFNTARAAAKTVLDKADATKEEVANTLKDLNDAHTGLKNNPVDKSALQTKYDEVKDLEKGDYTDESWNTFNTARAAAKTVLDKADATKEEVANALKDLNDAHTGLKNNPVDKSALQTKYDEVKDLEKGDYTDESWNTFNTARAAAKTVLDKADATKEEVANTLKDLNDAHTGLKNNPVDKEALQDKYDEVKDLEKGDYTDESWNTFNTARAAAKTVLDKADATKEEVANALKDLNDAHTGLKNNPVDKEALQDKYDEVKDLEKGDYTDESWNTFNTARAAAKTVLDKADATQKEVASALEELNAAHTDLIEKPVTPEVNKDILKETINKAEAKILDKEKYTPDSVRSLEEEIERAKRVFDDVNSTEIQVREAISRLNNAFNNLKIKEEEAYYERNNSGLSHIIFNYDYRNENNNHKDVQEIINFKFVDIVGHWAEEIINYVVDKGNFKGIDETHFAPDKAITRGEFITVLGRMADINPNNYNKSKAIDVKSSEYYYEYVNWAIEIGIAKGYEDGSFRANNSLTREEMAVLLINTLNYMKRNINENLVSEFNDDLEISSWAKDAVYRLVSSGFLKGVGDNNFSPKSKLTRAETAQIIYNVK